MSPPDDEPPDSRRPDSGRLREHLLGARLPRRRLLASVGALLGVASVAFLAGASVGLRAFFGWIALTPAVAVAAGIVGAGLAPTVGSIGLVTAWGYVFPPLVGYLTGEWAAGSRYSYPRMLSFAHGSARAELVGGLESAVEFGLPLAVGLGAAGYGFGVAVRSVARRVSA